MERLVTMSIKEVDRSGILLQVQKKQITKVQAAQQMGITRQQVDRLYKNFRF